MDLSSRVRCSSSSSGSSGEMGEVSITSLSGSYCVARGLAEDGTGVEKGGGCC